MLQLGGTGGSPLSVQVAFPTAHHRSNRPCGTTRDSSESIGTGRVSNLGTKGLHGPIPASDSDVKSITTTNDGYAVTLSYSGDPVRIDLDKNFLVRDIVNVRAKVDEKPTYRATSDGWVYSGNEAFDESEPAGRAPIKYEFGLGMVDGLRLPATVRVQVNENIDYQVFAERLQVEMEWPSR